MSDLLERIVSDPEIRSGKPVIRGTRITVSDVLGYMAGGMTPDEIVEDFPQLTPEDIRAVLSFAAERCDRIPRKRAVTGYSFVSFRKAAAELHPIYEECLQYWNGSKNETIPKGLFLQLIIAFRLVYLETESANFIRLLKSMRSNATPAEIESLLAIEESWQEALETCIGLSVDGRVYEPKDILNILLNGFFFHQDEANRRISNDSADFLISQGLISDLPYFAWPVACSRWMKCSRFGLENNLLDPEMSLSRHTCFGGLELRIS